jgi:hypothetical protein
MKATELRIGNWVNGEFINGEFLLSQIFRIDGNDDCSGLEPIPLTTELLEKCGFVRSQDEDENSLTLINGRKTFKWVEGNDDDYFLIYQTDCGLDYNTAFELEYLHQLQNLYFALTGEELEINL